MAAEQNDFVQILNSLLSSDNAIRQVAEVSVQKKKRKPKDPFCLNFALPFDQTAQSTRENLYIECASFFFWCMSVIFMRN